MADKADKADNPDKATDSPSHPNFAALPKEQVAALQSTSPLDTLPSGGGADLGSMLGEQAEAVKAAVKARRAEASETGDFAAHGAEPSALNAKPRQENAAEVDEADEAVTGFEATAIASLDELKAAEEARLAAEPLFADDSSDVFEDNDPTSFQNPRATIVAPPGPASRSTIVTPPGPASRATIVTPPGAVTMLEDKPDSVDVVIPMTGDLDIFEEESESTVFTPYEELMQPGATPPEASAVPAAAPTGLPKAAPAPKAERIQSHESTSFDDPELKSIRDKLMREAKEAKLAAQIQQSSVPAPTAPPDDGLQTMVDTQLSEADLQRIHQSSRPQSHATSHEKATDVERPAAGQGDVQHLRHCGCDTHQTNRAVNALRTLQAQGGRGLFVLLGFLVLLGGSAAALKWGLVRLGHIQGVLGLVLLGIGVGVIAGAFLSIRAQDGQQNKLLVESLLLASLGAAALGVSLLVQGLNVFQVEAMGIALQQPWGAPFVREALLWFICLEAGLIGGWSFRLQHNTAALHQDLPEYSDILSEFRDPDMERTGRSYNDMLQRSKGEVALLNAASPGSDGVKCFYCFRDAVTLRSESVESPWQAWYVGCPHCNEKLCIQHFADNAWQCRSCGKAIRNQIKRCSDCPPGQLPDGQRALLCPHCHQWKGCADHIKARGGKCPTCSNDIKAFADAYGRL